MPRRASERRWHVIKPEHPCHVNWQPSSWLMLRGSINEGFMAPTLPALYLSQRWSPTTTGILDPYRNPYLNEGRYTDRYITGGNPDMKPTESKGRTFGFVVDVPGVQGLSVTADYWKITRTNMVGTRSEAVILQNDAALLRAFVAAEVARGVNPNSIDLGGGTASYVGDPDVLRNALTDEDRTAFAAWNTANPGNPAAPVGRIFSHTQLTRNFNSSDHRGVDVGFRYALPRQPWGRIVIEFGSELAVARADAGPELRHSGGQQWPVHRWRSPVAQHPQSRLGPGRLERQSRHLPCQQDDRQPIGDCSLVRKPRQARDTSNPARQPSAAVWCTAG